MRAKKKGSQLPVSDNSSRIYGVDVIFNMGEQLAFALRGSAAGIGCAVFLAAGFAVGANTAGADSILQQVGVTQLQQLNPLLNGAGMSVGQVESSVGAASYTSFQYEPNPQNTNPSASFTFRCDDGASTAFSSSSYSWHADDVANIFYGSASGVVPGVSSVYVYEIGDFANLFVFAQRPLTGSSGIAAGTNPEVVNQSFEYVNEPLDLITYIDNAWDNYAAANNTLFITAVGDGGSQATGTTPASSINEPADDYNGIAVAAYGGGTGVGPTYDGRSKPDITAPGSYTSFSTPVVSGVATLMIQAGRGTDLSGPVGLESSDAAIVAQGATAYTTAATDIRTVKALLLNGAVKPTGWTNSYTVNSGTYTYHAVNVNAITPLDPRYGAGVVNAYNSYENLAGGEHNFTSATAQSIAALPGVTSAPVVNFSSQPVETASAANPFTITGWNLASIAAGTTTNAVENYDFNLPGTSANSWDLTATLTWNKDYNASGINHLLLFLLNSSGQQVASSTSLLDNVQQINISPTLGISALRPGPYDLAVEMLGGVNAISTSDTYALAWNFVDPTSAPEPAAFALLATGLGLMIRPRRRRAFCRMVE
ncbi:MAG: S8 family serine peptidase [Phycisphaerae bacterium]